MISTGYADGHEAPPMVIDGVMFVSTAGNQVLAIDAGSRQVLWRYKRDLPADMLGSHPTNRGVGFWGDKIFFVSRDSILVALDAKSGAELWTATMENYRNGYYSNLAPLVVDGKVIVGTSGGERGIRGYIAAYDAEDRQGGVAHLHHPGAGRAGSETWPQPGGEHADAWKTGGGSTWISGQYDPETKLIYWGIGNGGPWMGDQRPGDNLYVTSVVAMDPETGAIKGHFQYLPNKSLDWDEVAAPILVDVQKDGQAVPGLVHAARSGVLWELERTPEGPINFIKGTPYVKENWIKSMDPKTGRVGVCRGQEARHRHHGRFLPLILGRQGLASDRLQPGYRATSTSRPTRTSARRCRAARSSSIVPAPRLPAARKGMSRTSTWPRAPTISAKCRHGT